MSVIGSRIWIILTFSLKAASENWFPAVWTALSSSHIIFISFNLLLKSHLLGVSFLLVVGVNRLHFVPVFENLHNQPSQCGLSISPSRRGGLSTLSSSFVHFYPKTSTSGPSASAT